MRATMLRYLSAWNDLARQGSLPPARLAEGQRPFRSICTNVPNLLPLGSRSASMIILSFDQRASLMRRRHVGEFVRAAEFKSTDVLDDPALAHPIDLTIT